MMHHAATAFANMLPAPGLAAAASHCQRSVCSSCIVASQASLPQASLLPVDVELCNPDSTAVLWDSMQTLFENQVLTMLFVYFITVLSLYRRD